ncbi:hypothetical protein A5881_003955 [Enterococcus termitis]
MSNFNFYKVDRIYNELYFQFPKVLIASDKYKKMSDSTKIAYMLLKARLEFAVQKRQVDEDNNVYFTFTISELCDLLGCGKQKVLSIKTQLEDFGLLYQKQMGFNKELGKNNPNRLYLAELEVTENDIYQLTDFDKSINENVDKSEGMKIIPTPLSNLTLTNVNKSEGMKIIPSQNVDKSEGMKISTVFNNLKQDTLLDTKKIDTKKSSLVEQDGVPNIPRNENDIARLREKELLEHFSDTYKDRSFLSEDNLNLIAMFSDNLNDAENIQGILLRAKKAVEKNHNATLVIDESYIHNQALDIQGEIAKTLRRIYHKRQTDSTIENIDNYAFGSFKNLFDLLLCQLQGLEGQANRTITESPVTMHNWLE